MTGNANNKLNKFESVYKILETVNLHSKQKVPVQDHQTPK